MHVVSKPHLVKKERITYLFAQVYKYLWKEPQDTDAFGKRNWGTGETVFPITFTIF